MGLKNQKKIGLFYVGALPNMSQAGFFDWLKQMPELGIIANVSPFFVLEDDSANVAPKDWIKIAQSIRSHYKNYDGFVILHGVNNLLYTANALAFMLQNIGKPIIFTSGVQTQRKMDVSQESGIKANLINSVQIATFSLPEAGIVSGNRLVRATQAWHSHAESLNIFETPPEGVLGKIDFSIRIFDKNIRKKTKGDFKPFLKLSDKIVYLKMSPILTIAQLGRELEGAEGVMVDAKNLNLLPVKILLYLKKTAEKIPVIIYSPTSSPMTFAEDGMIAVSYMSKTAALIKLMWAVKQTKSLKVIKKIMNTDIAGEVG